MNEADPEWKGPTLRTKLARRYELCIFANLALWLAKPSPACFAVVFNAKRSSDLEKWSKGITMVVAPLLVPETPGNTKLARSAKPDEDVALAIRDDEAEYNTLDSGEYDMDGTHH